jgi:hypothetical protein
MAGGPDPRAVYPPHSYPVTYRPASAENRPSLGDFEKNPRCPAILRNRGRGRLGHKVTLCEIGRSPATSSGGPKVGAPLGVASIRELRQAGEWVADVGEVWAAAGWRSPPRGAVRLAYPSRGGPLEVLPQPCQTRAYRTVMVVGRRAGVGRMAGASEFSMTKYIGASVTLAVMVPTTWPS